MLSRKIILISGFGNACGHFWTLFSQQGSSLLFKSSYPLLLLKRNCRIKQKRQLSKAVSLVVRVVIQHFLKTIVVQFVFEVIG